MVMLEGEDVKQAVVETLLSTFPGIPVYKESSSNVVYPHFFVYQIIVLDQEERKNVHLLDYYMEIRYRVKSDPSTDLTLERDLDNIGLKLLQSFDIIDLEGEKVRCIEKSTSKTDGILHFFFTIRMMVKKVSNEEDVKQQKLGIQMELSEIETKE